VTLSVQWLTMVVMFASGLMLGVFLDLVRIVQDRYRIRKRLEAGINLFYWLLSAIFVFYLLWWSNWGELRFYVFVVICLGLILYFRLLSDRVRIILLKSTDLIEKIGSMILLLLKRLLWSPCQKVFFLLSLLVRGTLLLPFNWFRKNQEKK